jgi:hypothetical protein
MGSVGIEVSLDVKGSLQGNKFTLDFYTSDVLTPVAILSMIEHEIGCTYWRTEDMEAAKKRLKALHLLLDYYINDYSTCNSTYSAASKKIKKEIRGITRSIKERKKQSLQEDES